jgi:hypothetical protein
MNARKTSVGTAALCAAVLLTSMLTPVAATAAAPTAAPVTSQGVASAAQVATQREVPQPRALGTVITAGKAVYGKISTCLANQEVGLKCTSGDAGNIRAIYKKLVEIEKQMATNQAVLVERFASVEKLLEQVNKKLSQQQLTAIEKHLPLAQWALEALTECTEAYSRALPATPTSADIEKAKKDAQCQPYEGRAGGAREPMANIVEATASTQREFLEQVTAMSQFGSLPVSAAFFTGTRSSAYQDGLAWATWLHEVGEQNRGTGATAKSNGIPQGKTPIVTKRLSKDINAAMAYWDQLLNTYGMLKVVAAGIKGGAKEAERKQIAVDREIACTSKPCLEGTVSWAAQRFRLPELHNGQVLFTDTETGTLWKISDKPTIAQGSDLSINTVLRFSRAANRYATMSGLFKFNPESFAPAGPLPNSPTYGTRVGYSRTQYEVCLRNLCMLTTDPQTTSFSPLQTGATVDFSCWNPVNVEDKRPDWRTGSYDNYLGNPNMYTLNPNKFWKTGKDLYNQEIWAPVSMPWSMRDVRSKINAVVGAWGWGMSPACMSAEKPITSERGAMRDMGPAATVHAYLGWK